MGTFGFSRSFKRGLKKGLKKVGRIKVIAGDTEREQVLVDVETQLRAGRVSLPTRDLESNVTDLLKVKRTAGVGEYQRRLGVLRTWAFETGQRQAAEKERSGLRGFVRTAVRTVVPALVGGVVGSAIQRARGAVRTPPAAATVSRAAAVRAKIPYHLYAALAQAGDPRAEQLRLRGLVAPPAQVAAPSGISAVRAEISRQQASPIRSTPQYRAAAPMWGAIQPGWFGG